MARTAAARGKKRTSKASPSDAAAAPAPAVDGDGKNGPGEVGGGGGRFFCCYLLRSLCPRRKGHTYIGFSVNPRRRIRQHNGEIRCGAWRTKRGRPWEMVLCIYGFPTNVAALQFEWAWQHPKESLAVRKAAASFKSLGGVGNKVKLAYTMLNLPSWDSLNLTVNFFSTKNTKFMAGCPSLPGHMKTVVCSMEDLECLSSEDDSNDEPRDDQEPDVAMEDDDPSSGHGLQPGEEEVRVAGYESNNDDFAPMEWNGICEARRLRRSESSEVQPVEQETRIAGSNGVECSTDEFDYMGWGGIQERRESDVPRTSPRCSSSSFGNDYDDDGGRRIVDGLLAQVSPMLKVADACSSDGGDPLFFHGMDVVDLVTPVGCLRRKGSKMAKMIDLTSSPIIIEL